MLLSCDNSRPRGSVRLGSPRDSGSSSDTGQKSDSGNRTDSGGVGFDAGPLDGGADAPTVTLRASESRLTVQESVVFTAFVVDPDGSDDVVGGRLTAPTGEQYGEFVRLSSEIYELALDFEAINPCFARHVYDGGNKDFSGYLYRSGRAERDRLSGGCFALQRVGRVQWGLCRLGYRSQSLRHLRPWMWFRRKLRPGNVRDQLPRPVRHPTDNRLR